jgi:hypothetical protein
MAIQDPHGERARAEFFEEVASGTGFIVNRPYDDLGGRSLHEVWISGDHEAVERWLDTQYARTEAIVEQHRADPTYMAMIERRVAENAAARAAAAEANRSRRSA